MKNLTLSLLLTTPLFAGVEAPIMAPPAPDCEAGWTLGLEALYLRPYQSEGAYDNGDFEFGGRGSIGYDFNDCLFVKATYFGFEAEVSDDDGEDDNSNYPLFESDADLKVSYLDLVVGQHFKPSEKLKLSPYVGLRWATFEESTDLTEFGLRDLVRDTEISSEFSGLGIVVGIDGVRTLGGGFSLYGTAKQSVVFGTTDHSYSRSFQGTVVGDNALDLDSGDFEDDRVLYITELGLGLQYDFAFASVAANIRAGVEGQWWAGLSNDDSENVGLGGFVLGANFTF